MGDLLAKKYKDNQERIKTVLSFTYPRVQIIEWNKINSAIYNNLGCVYFRIGDYKQAIDRFKRAIKMADSVDSYYNLYELYKKIGKNWKAKRTLRKVHKITDYENNDG